MVEQRDTTTRSIDRIQGSSHRVTLPKKYVEACGIDGDDEIVFGLLEGKHGKHIGIWKQGEQPKSDE